MISKILKHITPWPIHPIDRAYGIETSQRVRRIFLRTGQAGLDQSNVGYVGSQPSIIRKCLDLLPDLKGAAFFDIGCGKGRVLAVASEYPFTSITGIELSKPLVRIARRNAAHLARRRPDHTPIQVLRANAVHAELPKTGTVVVFLYNPFHGDVTALLVDHLKRHIEASPGIKLFVVYYNPVHAALFDASDLFSRYYAELLHFSHEERNASPFGNDFDNVVIWQARSAQMARPLPHADRPVEVTVPELVAMVR